MRPPQFRLRTLMWLMAGLSVLFAVAAAVSTPTMIVIGWFICLGLLHLAAAAIGHRQRDRARRETRQQTAGHAGNAVRHQRPFVIAQHRLEQKSPVGLLVLASAVAGAVAGLSLGGFAFWGIGEVSAAGMIVGGASSAVVGGFAGFLLGSFLAMALRAWHDATRESPLEIPVESDP